MMHASLGAGAAVTPPPNSYDGPGSHLHLPPPHQQLQQWGPLPAPHRPAAGGYGGRGGEPIYGGGHLGGPIYGQPPGGGYAPRAGPSPAGYGGRGGGYGAPPIGASQPAPYQQQVRSRSGVTLCLFFCISTSAARQ